MLPILQAEESLNRITETAVGTGSLKKDEREKVMRELQRRADERKQKRTVDTNVKMAQLASMGIEVVDLRKRKIKELKD